MSAKELVYDAVLRRATDIHLEPTTEQLSVRYRIDGILHAAEPFDRPTGDAVINVFKVLSAMDISEKRKPQDGSFGAKLEGRDLDFRVATSGSKSGEKLVMRILDNAAGGRQARRPGHAAQARRARSAAWSPSRTACSSAAGRPGRARSTTLYACLREIDRFQKNIITVEDPIEYHLDNITQMEINTKSGQTFAGSLRSILRQDPDVIMIGEIRDQETATIACQAANTGHMVFSTVHANDTVTALFRLLDLGVEPFMIASASHRRILMDLCIDDFHRGEWGEAGELAAEGLRVCEERGSRFFGWYFRYHQALLAAVQGRFDTSQALADQMIGWAGPRGVRTAQVYARHALVLAALGQGDFESAYQHATAMSPAGSLAPYVPHCLWVVMDLVEAAVRTQRPAEADRHLRATRDADLAALSPRLAILAAASAAIAADDRQAPALFERALNLPTVDRWPFDAARVRLAYGERLRRTRATTQSRIHLQAALTAFQKLGAAPWASRAELELRATGATRMPSGARGADHLTPQELQIARLAASGLTNKQIAERLYLSPRTVGGHLYQIFPKLGITTRAALRDALGPADGS